MSKSLNSVVEDFQILEGETLLSDHWPVVMSSNIGIDSSDNIAHEATYTKSLLWKKVREKDLSRYQLCLNMELEMINIPVEVAICNDPEHCSHKDDIQRYYDKVIGAVMKSSKKSIPRGRSVGAKKPGWNEEVRKVKEAAINAYKLWREVGKFCTTQ